MSAYRLKVKEKKCAFAFNHNKPARMFLEVLNHKVVLKESCNTVAKYIHMYITTFPKWETERCYNLSSVHMGYRKDTLMSQTMLESFYSTSKDKEFSFFRFSIFLNPEQWFSVNDTHFDIKKLNSFVLESSIIKHPDHLIKNTNKFSEIQKIIPPI